MAKGQKRSTREPKKPKSDKKKTGSASLPAQAKWKPDPNRLAKKT